MAAASFSDTDQVLATAESLAGPYVWGVFDVLLLPPGSFPQVGMENPGLTFANPVVLSGGRSGVRDFLAHEVAHSWAGNLVTNANFEHFWLNEGLATFLEQKIIGELKGEDERRRHMEQLSLIHI